MEEKQSFFSLLSPKSALLLGLVGGVLVLCTLGFFIMLGLVWGGKISLGSTGGALAYNTDTAGTGANQPLPPPPTVPKSARPNVELFVMSYCPYGLQMEKAYLPAWQLLKDKADISVKFVDYAMHGKKEVDENTVQYCIEGEQPTKYQAYLQCFVASGDSASCMQSAGVSASKVTSCVNKANDQFGILAKYNDQASWLSGQFPIYPVHGDLNVKYGVQGSPTLIINGTEAQVPRTAEAIKQAICAAFNNPPSECSQSLPNTNYSSGFGLAVATPATAAAAGAACGS